MINSYEDQGYVTRQIFDKAMDILKKEADVEVFEGVDNLLLEM